MVIYDDGTEDGTAHMTAPKCGTTALSALTGLTRLSITYSGSGTPDLTFLSTLLGLQHLEVVSTEDDDGLPHIVLNDCAAAQLGHLQQLESLTAALELGKAQSGALPSLSSYETSSSSSSSMSASRWLLPRLTNLQIIGDLDLDTAAVLAGTCPQLSRLRISGAVRVSLRQTDPPAVLRWRLRTLLRLQAEGIAPGELEVTCIDVSVEALEAALLAVTPPGRVPELLWVAAVTLPDVPLPLAEWVLRITPHAYSVDCCVSALAALPGLVNLGWVTLRGANHKVDVKAACRALGRLHAPAWGPLSVHGCSSFMADEQLMAVAAALHEHGVQLSA